MSVQNSTHLQNCPSFTECAYLSSPFLSSPAQSSCQQQVKHVLCKSLPSGVIITVDSSKERNPWHLPAKTVNENVIK